MKIFCKFLVLFAVLFLCFKSSSDAQLSSTHRSIKINQKFLYNEALEATPDGGFLISGYEDGNFMQAFAKFDSLGNNIWCKTYFSGSKERTPHIYQTEWDDYLLATSTIFNTYVLRCIDQLGNAKWQAMINPALGSNIRVCSHQNGMIYFIAGLTPGGLIVKVDSSGNLLWQKAYTGPLNSYLRFTDIVKLTETSMIISGTYNPLCNNVLIKIDTSGNIIWSKNLLIQNASIPDLKGIRLFRTSQGNVFGTGMIGFDESQILFEVDTSGAILWTKKIDSDHLIHIYYITQNPSGDLLCSGSAYDTVTGYNASFIGRMDSKGHNLEGFVLGSDSVFIHHWSQIAALSSGKFAFTTVELIDPINIEIYTYLALFDSSFESSISCNSRPISFTDSITTVNELSVNIHDTNMVITYINGAPNTIPAMINDSLLCISTTGIINPTIWSEVNIYPNPADNEITIMKNQDSERYNCRITDLNGKILLERRDLKGSVSLNVSQFYQGMYVLTISTNNNIFHQKLIVNHTTK